MVKTVDAVRRTRVQGDDINKERDDDVSDESGEAADENAGRRVQCVVKRQ